MKRKDEETGVLKIEKKKTQMKQDRESRRIKYAGK